MHKLASLTPAPAHQSAPPQRARSPHLCQPAAPGYYGNQAVLRSSRTTPRIQTKLQVGATNDPLEAEADQVADRVMRMTDSSIAAGNSSPVVRRMCPERKGEMEEGDKVQRMEASSVVRRLCPECKKDEEDKQQNIQRKSASVGNSGGPAPQSVHEVLGSPGRPLAAPDRAFFEPRLGADLSAVRIHDDGHAAESARAIGARAYTLGSHVAFAGPMQASSEPGRRLLAHELAHVLQQDPAGKVARRDSEGGAQDAGGSAQQTVVDRVIAALNEPQENGVGNYREAYSILNGLWIVEMMQQIEQLRARGQFDLLKGNDPGEYPRVTVAIAAVEAKGTRAAAQFPAHNPAFSSIEEQQQHEVATYLGLPWPLSQAASAAGGKAGEWTTGEVVLVGAVVVVGAALIIVFAPELIPAAATFARGAVVALRIGTAVATALPAAAAGGDAIVLAEVTTTAVEAAPAVAEAGGAALRGAQVLNLVVRSAQPVAQAVQAVAPAAQIAVTSSAPTLAQAAAAIAGLGASATLLKGDGPDKKDDKKEDEPSCNVGRYGSLQCLPGEQGHHIVADYTLRFGSRAEGIAGQKRIPGFPSFNDGPAICLKGHRTVEGDQHNIAHGADAAIEALGAAGSPKGTAPISAITAISIAGATSARNCPAKIVAGVAQQPSLLGSTPARTTIMPPGKWPP